MSSPSGSVSPADISSRILMLRGQRVLLDADLAALYGVPTKVLNQAVRRNESRFPEDFLIRAHAKEWSSQRSQTVTLESGRGRHRKYPPLAFTEHGAIMAATVLNSPRTLQVVISPLVDASSHIGNFLLDSNWAIRGD